MQDFRSSRSAASSDQAPFPAERLERVWGWNMSVSAMSRVYRPSTVDDIRTVLELARARGSSVGLRGAGQSYGDAALYSHQICLDLSGVRRILAWDPESGVISVEPGVTVGDVWRHTIADGWWPQVVPGTMHATAGGCAAMNVHGKNNWKVGPIGEHIVDFELLLPTGEVRHCSRTEHADLFHAAIGGFGMLGCFLAIRLRLKRVHSGVLAVEAMPRRNLDHMLATFEERAATADYLVGWVDASGSGDGLGRGVVHQANDLAPGEDPDPARTLCVAGQELPASFYGVPKSVIWRFIRPFMNGPGVRAVNGLRYHASRLRG